MIASTPPIAVLGAGSWGTALALLLARNGHEVRLWGHDASDMQLMQDARENARYLPGYIFPELLTPCLELTDALQNVRDIVLVVPSHAFRSVLERVVPLVNHETRFVWGTKGLDAQTGETLDHVARHVLGPDAVLAILSGPSFATEVAKALPTAVTLATRDEAFFGDLQARFCNDNFRLYRSDDLVGVELCGVMKNVLAIAAGMSDGLGFGANARSALLTRGLAELARLLAALGGQAQTLMSLAGIGDVILTCTTDQSRNRRFGLLIGEGRSTDEAINQIGQVVEGYYNVAQLYQLSQRYTVDMPIVAAVYSVLQGHQSPSVAAAALMSRQVQGRWG